MIFVLEEGRVPNFCQKIIPRNTKEDERDVYVLGIPPVSQNKKQKTLGIPFRVA
jgi:hypothetical protein